MVVGAVAATTGCYTQLGYHYVEEEPDYEEVVEYVTETGEDSVVVSHYYYEDEFYYVRPRRYRNYFSTFYGDPYSSYSASFDPFGYDSRGWGSSMNSCLFSCYYGYDDPWLYGSPNRQFGQSSFGFGSFGYASHGFYGYSPYSRYGYYAPHGGRYGYTPFGYYGGYYGDRLTGNYRPRGSTVGRGSLGAS